MPTARRNRERAQLSAINTRQRSIPYGQAAHAADCRPSDVHGPPTAAVKAARNADLTEQPPTACQAIHASSSSSLGSTRQPSVASISLVSLRCPS
ncbi:hypothetical protein EVAR_42375_1 [Eumeta japonica]|uniref:Uncharacterized protein n=1 Tax=Eumeta variegata TaxID=151549 RepID=A0A4C1YJX4_EUMVA|nr:hypothetical protein EVAR_42375_1 [Eumeta japonica]